MAFVEAESDVNDIISEYTYNGCGGDWSNYREEEEEEEEELDDME